MTDLTRCPLCNKSNQCAAHTEQPNACWCFVQRLDTKALQSLALDPAQGCLCPACLSQLAKNDEPPCA